MGSGTWYCTREKTWVLIDKDKQRAIIDNGGYRWRLTLSEPWNYEPTKYAAQVAVRTALKKERIKAMTNDPTPLADLLDAYNAAKAAWDAAEAAYEAARAVRAAADAAADDADFAYCNARDARADARDAYDAASEAAREALKGATALREEAGNE